MSRASRETEGVRWRRHESLCVRAQRPINAIDPTGLEPITLTIMGGITFSAAGAKLLAAGFGANGLYVLRYRGEHQGEVRGVEFLEGNSNLGDARQLDRDHAW